MGGEEGEEGREVGRRWRDTHSEVYSISCLSQ